MIASAQEVKPGALVSSSPAAFKLTATDVMTRALSVVQVTSRLVGTGTVVLVENEPMLLTNSHVLQGAVDAKINTGQSFGSLQKPIEFEAKTVFDSPIADVALLRPVGLSRLETAEFSKLGALNARFCNPEKSPETCAGGLVRPEVKRHQYYSGIATVVQKGEHESIPNLIGYEENTFPDTYLSGFYAYMIRIPTCARPGMSGSAFYGNDLLEGLLAKVDLAPSCFSYAIPVTEIARVIARHYFKAKKGLWLPESAWIETGSTRSLQVKYRGSTLIAGSHSGSVGSAGGETGNVGGETGNVGGETGNVGTPGSAQLDPTRFWSLHLTHDRPLQTANPFRNRASSLQIDGKSALYFEVGPSADHTFTSASIARAAWLNRNRRDWHPVFRDEKNTLFRLRQAQSVHPIYARRYLRKGIAGFEQIFVQEPGPEGGSRFDPSAQALYPDEVSRSESTYATADPSLHPWQNFEFRSQASKKPKDPLYSARPRGSNWFLNVESGTAPFAARVPRDLKNVWVRQTETTWTELHLISPSSSETLIYQSKGGDYRAAILFDDRALEKMERIFILTPGELHEFVACRLGKDCIR